MRARPAHERPRRLYAAGSDRHVRVRHQRRGGRAPAAARPVRRGVRHVHRGVRRRDRARRLHRRGAAGRAVELELSGGVDGGRRADGGRLSAREEAALSGAAVRCDRARPVRRGRRAEGAGLQRERRGGDPARHVQRGGRRRDPQREIYALAALFGATVEVVSLRTNWLPALAPWLAIGSCVAIRLSSLYFGWRLPTFGNRPKDGR